jgi:site-specific DNA recombinase
VALIGQPASLRILLADDGVEQSAQTAEPFASANEFEIVDSFSDEGVSGTTPCESRAGFKKLLAALFANGARTVLVEDTDRLGRHQEVIHTVIGTFQRAGFTLIMSKGQNLTSEGINDRLMLGINASVAEYVKSQLVDRLRSARQRIRDDGRKCEGRKPYGSTVEERAVLAQMKALRKQGLSLAEIAATLNRQNVLPRSGKWHRQAVHTLLRRQVSA